MFFRVEAAIRPEYADPEADLILRAMELSAPSLRRNVRWGRMLNVYWASVEAPRDKVLEAVSEIFKDPVSNWLFTGDLIPSASGERGEISNLFDAAPFRFGKFWGLEKFFRPGVTDNIGRTATEAFKIVVPENLKDVRVCSGKLLVLEGPDITEDEISDFARSIFVNELIESWSILRADELKSPDRFHPDQVKSSFPRVAVRTRYKDPDVFDLTDSSADDLAKMSKDRLWALNADEMLAIQAHFYSDDVKSNRSEFGLDHPTDVELEVIAQTWSEHCKHKLFNAKINYQDHSSGESSPSAQIPNEVDSLFKTTISGTTKELPRPWLISVFTDNAGIIEFDDDHAICIKVETHNSPSALDPYGGSLTGIVGVNRDIMGCGIGAKPIFNTDVFCLAEPNHTKTLPDRILHPRRILDGVRLGVEHGGNKSGIPTINGALFFDERYLGKPLIFCGTGGIIPRKIGQTKTHEKVIRPGDRICMVGGRVGKDGIHGATFSSLPLDKSSPVTAVQLGDPITQRRMQDFLLEARDQGIYRAITDNGAGGLSSSVGELAEITGGARIDVSKASTKYEGLKPYEIVISESQERMTVAVPPQYMSAFLDLAKRRQVEVSDLGEFTSSGFFEIQYKDKTVGRLNLEFLHHGVPQIQLEAHWKGVPKAPGAQQTGFHNRGKESLLKLLKRPNIASKEWLIRQYDHEVQGMSVIKPLSSKGALGKDGEHSSGPNDCGVIKPLSGTWKGVAVGCGLAPRLSDWDPYRMAQASIDESIRNILAAGAEYGNKKSVLSLVDNFCWPDPVANQERAGDLVRTCFGLRDAALALEVPFVSGKDSMKNDYHGKRNGEEVSISVVPTLLITAVGRVADVRKCRSADFKAPGDRIFLLSAGRQRLLSSELHSIAVDRLKEKGGKADQVVLPVEADPDSARFELPEPNWELARRVYAWLGGTRGDSQVNLRSVHDVSDGGLLVSIAESLITRDLGAKIEIPENNQFGDKVDPWEFAFGEGFHGFVCSAPAKQASELVEEWTRLELPFLELGEVQSSPVLDVTFTGSTWSASVSEIRDAWVRGDYWQ